MYVVRSHLNSSLDSESESGLFWEKYQKFYLPALRKSQKEKCSTRAAIEWQNRWGEMLCWNDRCLFSKFAVTLQRSESLLRKIADTQGRLITNVFGEVWFYGRNYKKMTTCVWMTCKMFFARESNSNIIKREWERRRLIQRQTSVFSVLWLKIHYEWYQWKAVKIRTEMTCWNYRFNAA